MPFLNDDFLLESEPARELYHDVARSLPIIDFHNHLSAADIAEDRRFENIGRLWLEGDHYKWRAMRACGVHEEFITGTAEDRRKFDKWADTVPKTLCNPLYQWTHMELSKPFGMDDVLLGPETADRVWNETRARLAEPGFSARGLLKHFNVEILCTTDDPADSLQHHHVLAARDFPVRVIPAFRPDRALAVQDPPGFRVWVERLSEASRMSISTGSQLIEALAQRASVFHDAGCRLADHGLDEPYGEDCTRVEFDRVFELALRGEVPDTGQIRRYRSRVMRELSEIYHGLGWTQQLHIGPVRNPNTRLFQTIGADAGFDTMGDAPSARALCHMLDAQDRDGNLPRTILYTINPSANDMLAAVSGSFNDGSIPDRVRMGPAWWFNDQKSGIEELLHSVSSVGLLSRFPGMVTDSRCLLSMSRHDWFRRILCNLLGSDIRRGLIPHDMNLIGALVRDLCHGNAARLFPA